MTVDGYDAAREGVLLVERPDRTLLQAVGRSPERMLTGILSGAMPPPFTASAGDRRAGSMPCSAMLTPKGKLVTDLRVGRIAEGEEGALLLDLPVAGVRGALDHFQRYLPPRLARVEPPENPLGLLTLVGPDAAGIVAEELGAFEPSAMAEGDLRLLDDGTALGLRLVRGGEAVPATYDVVAHEETLAGLRARLRGRGIPAGDPLLWETLRIEKGRPAFGAEMDGDTLPQEAGIERRCIDFRKGCFTGQEVVVRIRDRGHVNRRLRGLLLGDVPVPPRGTPLFDRRHGGQPAGEIRSSVRSPRFGETIGLGYVRREVEPPAELALAAPEGTAARVRALDDAGWVLVEGESFVYP